MKRSKEELLKVITENEGITDETKVALLEDIADSFEEGPDMSAYVDKAAYDELKQKYIERFTSGAEVKKDPEPEEEPEEKEISIDDLFVEDEEEKK